MTVLPLLLLAVALVQTPAERPADGTNRPALTNGELIDMLDTYAIVQAQKALELGDEQYAQFVTRLKRLHQVRRQNTRTRNQILQDLRRLTQSATTDENTLRARIKALDEHDTRAAEELRRAYDAMDEVLDARQQARFRLFEERLERQKLDLLMRARNRAGRAGTQPRR
jgi:Spy/CpxP family protein refolding chaperone